MNPLIGSQPEAKGKAEGANHQSHAGRVGNGESISHRSRATRIVRRGGVGGSRTRLSGVGGRLGRRAGRRCRRRGIIVRHTLGVLAATLDTQAASLSVEVVGNGCNAAGLPFVTLERGETLGVVRNVGSATDDALAIVRQGRLSSHRQY